MAAPAWKSPTRLLLLSVSRSYICTLKKGPVRPGISDFHAGMEGNVAILPNFGISKSFCTAYLGYLGY